jgi:hypothetical protein
MIKILYSFQEDDWLPSEHYGREYQHVVQSIFVL